jgi:hypothetical protein
VSPTATVTAVVLDRRFNGPPETANGGYACGVVASHVDGPAHVSLRRPVPLGAALELERHDDGHVTLHDGELLIAEGDPALPLDLEPPYRPTVEEARAAAAQRPDAWPAAFHSCWVCSPAREDGLGVVFGRLAGHPDATAAVLDAGTVAPEVVWAALDCPSYTPPLWGNATPSLLAAMHAELLEPVPARGPVAVVGWTLGSEGRKHRSATAILAGDGRVLARASALWIRLRG